MRITSVPIHNLNLILAITLLVGCQGRYSDLPKEANVTPVEVIIDSIKVKKIALTFDDGPDGRYTPEILDILKEKHVKATFFLVGRNMKKFPAVTKRIIKEGHCIGNHTYDHSHMLGKSFRSIYKNILKNESISDSLGGKSAKLFRPPWGLISDNQIDSLNFYGFKIIPWDINSRDWSKESNPEDIVRIVTSQAQNNDIVLFHSADYALKESRINTVKALPAIIDILRAKRFIFIKVNEMDSVMIKVYLSGSSGTPVEE